VIEEADDLAAQPERRRRDDGDRQRRGEREGQAVAAASKGRRPSGDLGPASVVRRVGERDEARVQLGIDQCVCERLLNCIAGRLPASGHRRERVAERDVPCLVEGLELSRRAVHGYR